MTGRSTLREQAFHVTLGVLDRSFHVTLGDPDRSFQETDVPLGGPARETQPGGPAPAFLPPKNLCNLKH